MSKMTFQEAFENMSNILEKETLTSVDYREFMSTPILESYTSEEKLKLEEIREAMMIRSQEVIKKDRTFNFLV